MKPVIIIAIAVGFSVAVLGILAVSSTSESKPTVEMRSDAERLAEFNKLQQDVKNAYVNALPEMTKEQRMVLAIQNPEKHQRCYESSTTQFQYDSCLRSVP